MRLLKLLNEPYPYYLSGVPLWRISFIVFLFTFLFYYLIQPFDVNRSEHLYNFFWTSVLHAVIPGFVMMILGILIDHTFDFEKKWTVKYEFIFFSFFLLIVGLGQFLIRDFIYLIQENWSINYLVEEVRNTFLVGGFFMCIAIPWNFNYLKNRNQERAAKLDFKRSYPKSSESIRIKTKVKAETFNLQPEKFLFARAEGNYIDIVIREGDKVCRLLKRISIKELMDQISEQENNIHQTHRSYVINFGNMNKVTGNAAGYKVLFNHVEEYALVSRSRIPMFEEKLKLLTNDKLNAQTEL